MSGRILRQVRITQNRSPCSLPSLHISRRCYAVSAALKSSPPDSQYSDAAGPSYVTTITESTHLADVQDVQTDGDAIAHEEVQAHSQDLPAPSRGSRKAKDSASSRTHRRDGIPQQSVNVEAYLASIHAAGKEPTLADLERCRPASHANHTSPQYAVDYKTVVETLCRAFSKEQLRNFLEQWDSSSAWCRRHRRKVQYAEYIVEKMWKWPSLKEVERAKRDRTEVSVKSFAVTASELFLLLGKDGADLLEMSLTYNVHISLTTHPLALRVEGFRGSLKRLTEHIESVKQSIVHETYQLPTKVRIPQDIVQQISRLAGAFLENMKPDGMVKMHAKNKRNLEIVKRLATRASHELNQRLQQSRLVYLPPEQSDAPYSVITSANDYSLYPFLSPRPLPWTMNAGGVFRIRRVGKWFGHGQFEPMHKTRGGLADSGGRFETIMKQSVDLHDLLLPALHLTTQSPSRKTAKASMGHVLIATTSPGQRATLVPPLEGERPLEPLLKWMDDTKVRTAFVPSLPALLVNSSPARQKNIHRLIYHAMPATAEHVSRNDPQTASACMKKALYFEMPLSQSNRANAEFVPESATAEGHSDATRGQNEDPTSRPRCWTGIESQIDLMLPDRPMDMQLSSIAANDLLPEQIPSELRVYMTSLEAFFTHRDPDTKQPDPPLFIRLNGDTFILHANVSVRQSREFANISGRSGRPDRSDTPSMVNIISESILDLESNQKSAHCEITCDDPTSKASWKRFLEDCDMLTSSTYRPTGSIILEKPDNDNEF